MNTNLGNIDDILDRAVEARQVGENFFIQQTHPSKLNVKC